MSDRLERREFITLLSGAAAWPITARAQQPEGMRRVGALMGYPEAQSELASFLQGLQKLGWVEGRNLRIDTRWGIPADPDSMHRFARELVALQPDLILSQSTPATAALLQERESFRLSSRLSPIRSAVASSRASRGRVATPPASRLSSLR